jgi:quercetin dioxygenase-like cupin family protein
VRLLDTALTVVGLALRAIAPEQSTTRYAAFQMIMRQFVVKEALMARQGEDMSTDFGSEGHSDRPIVVGPDEGNLRWFMSTLLDMKVYGKHTNGAFSLIDTIVAPNSLAAPPHIHEAMDEAFYILEGTLAILAGGGEPMNASAGTFLFVPRGSVHGFSNAGGTPARVLVFHTPTGYEGLYEEMSEPAPERRLPPPPKHPPDMERLAAIGRKYRTISLPPARSGAAGPPNAPPRT